MSKVSASSLAGCAALGLALGGAAVHAGEPESGARAGPAAVLSAPQAPPAAPPAAMGLEPVAAEALDGERGGTAVDNDMLSQGYVSENQAVNVTTGANIITEGSFANAGGVPMVVQNTGNNVLIQNSTILNVQVK